VLAERLARRRPLVASAVVASVARGDFNVWSDVDVVVVAEGLPERAPERGAVLGEDVPAASSRSASRRGSSSKLSAEATRSRPKP
jgi:predicted nucleotidyltransferase